jgi:hypothetical protein
VLLVEHKQGKLGIVFVLKRVWLVIPA